MGSSKRPKLGQHFLKDTGIIEKIISSARISASDRVVEIGPGKGALTRHFPEDVENLTLIEPDHELAELLAEEFPLALVLNEKGEEADYENMEGPLNVVSNLPYYASVPIFKRLTEHKRNISRMTLMFQKEVAQRISSGPGRRHYGSLSVWAGYNWEMEKVVDVPPSAFSPPPKVESSVISFIPRRVPPVDADEEALFRLVRASFVRKRRTLVNNLKNVYLPASIEDAMAAEGLGKNARAEEMTIGQFAGMSKRLKLGEIDPK